MARIPTAPKQMLPLVLQRWLQNPTMVSTIASLGAHALLFALWPLLPNSALKSSEPEIKEPVGIVQLTPEEQSRLPDISTAPPELPAIARQPLPDQTAPLGQTQPFNLSPLPNQSVPPNFPSYVPPAFPPFIFAPQPETPQRVIIPTEPETASPQPSTSPTPTASASPSPASPQPTASPSDRPTPTPGQTSDNLPFNPGASPDVAVSPSSQPKTPEEIRQAQIQAETARIRQRSQEIAAQAQAQSPDDTAVGQGAVSSTFSTWSAAVNSWLEGNEQKIQQGTWRKPRAVTGIYPKPACPLQPKQPVLIGVLVDGKGKVTNEVGKRPQLVQGSGFAVFNRQAIEEAAAASFEPTGEKEAYLVQFNYEATAEICSANSPAPAQPQSSPSQAPPQ